MKLGLAATILGPSMFARISLLQGNLKISHGKQRVPRTSDMDLLTENFWKTKRGGQTSCPRNLGIYLLAWKPMIFRQQRRSLEKKTWLGRAPHTQQRKKTHVFNGFYCLQGYDFTTPSTSNFWGSVWIAVAAYPKILFLETSKMLWQCGMLDLEGIMSWNLLRRCTPPLKTISAIVTNPWIGHVEGLKWESKNLQFQNDMLTIRNLFGSGPGPEYSGPPVPEGILGVERLSSGRPGQDLMPADLQEAYAKFEPKQDWPFFAVYHTDSHWVKNTWQIPSSLTKQKKQPGNRQQYTH